MVERRGDSREDGDMGIHSILAANRFQEVKQLFLCRNEFDAAEFRQEVFFGGCWGRRRCCCSVGSVVGVVGDVG